jgi:hypothetical protein
VELQALLLGRLAAFGPLVEPHASVPPLPPHELKPRVPAGRSETFPGSGGLAAPAPRAHPPPGSRPLLPGSAARRGEEGGPAPAPVASGKAERGAQVPPPPPTEALEEALRELTAKLAASERALAEERRIRGAAEQALDRLVRELALRR